MNLKAYINLALELHAFEGLHHLLFLLVSLRPHLSPSSQKVIPLRLDLKRPIVVVLDLFHDLLSFVLLDPLYPLDSLLPVTALKVLQFLLVAKFFVFDLLSSHHLLVLLLPLVDDALLASLLHLDHRLANVLSVVLLLLLLLNAATSLGLCLSVLLPLALLSFSLGPQELLLSLLLKAIVLLLDKLDLSLLLGCSALHLKALLFSSLFELLSLLLSLPFLILEELSLSRKKLLLAALDLFDLSGFLLHLEVRVSLALSVLLLYPGTTLLVLDIHLALPLLDLLLLLFQDLLGLSLELLLLATLFLVTALGIELPLLLSLSRLLGLLLVLSQLLLLSLPLGFGFPLSGQLPSSLFLLLPAFGFLLLAEKLSLARLLPLALLLLLLLVALPDLLHLLLMNKHLLDLLLLLKFDALECLPLFLDQSAVRGTRLGREARDCSARALELAWRPYGVTHPAHLGGGARLRRGAASGHLAGSGRHPVAVSFFNDDKLPFLLDDFELLLSALLKVIPSHGDLVLMKAVGLYSQVLLEVGLALEDKLLRGDALPLAGFERAGRVHELVRFFGGQVND